MLIAQISVSEIIEMKYEVPRLAAAIGSQSNRSNISFKGAPSSSSTIEIAVSDGKGGT